MEVVSKFLECIIESNSWLLTQCCGCGCASGAGNDAGSGWGLTTEFCDNIRECSGCTYGDGCGNGKNSSDGSYDGTGYGGGYSSGSGSRNGTGSGASDGAGVGIKSYCGRPVYIIDSVPTLIDKVRGNVAKGHTFRDDMTLRPCYIVKHGYVFAHGDTLKDARDALAKKVLECLPLNERIAAFVEAHEYGKHYSNKDYFEWHHKLTGSCLYGRKEWVHNKGIDMSGSMTVLEFIALTKNAYGGYVVKQLEAHYK